MNPLDAFDLLAQSEAGGLVAMFWVMILLEIPRYGLPFLMTGLVEAVDALKSSASPRPVLRPRALHGGRPKISIIIAGHNEAGAMRACLRSIREQTVQADEIIAVDDGSTDGMRDVLRQLRAEGLIHVALSNRLRCGKAAACNLAIVYATGDIIINIDADCSFDCDAIEKILAPMHDLKVGAVSGNIGVRNSRDSVIASLQEVEYLISISLGKRAMDLVDMVACASGAFSAFRREALAQIGGNAAGPGEDFDMTTRLRRSGWDIRFAPDAWCMTDAPATLIALVNQRRRWDRDTIRLRMRKFRDNLLPTRHSFQPRLTLDQIDFVIFNLISSLVFPGYLLFLFLFYGSATWNLLWAVSLVYLVFDLGSFAIAVAVSRRRGMMRLWPYALIYGLFNAYVMRFVRLYAYFEEWVFRTSYADRYVPSRVLRRSPYY